MLDLLSFMNRSDYTLHEIFEDIIVKFHFQNWKKDEELFTNILQQKFLDSAQHSTDLQRIHPDRSII